MTYEKSSLGAINVQMFLFLPIISLGVLNRYIMVGQGICEKYQSRDGQISRVGTAREILSQDWKFFSTFVDL